MTDHVFARIRLDGKRYEGGRLPIRSLDELKRYQELVLEAARIAWTDQNSTPVPDDFSNSLELKLVDLESGSAVSVLERTPSSYDEYFDSGRDEVDRELAGALSGAPYEDLRLLEFEAFSEFGSSLAPNEVLEVSSGRTAPIVVTEEKSREVFKRLAADWRKSNELPSKGSRHTKSEWVVGRLTALNADRKNYTIRRLDRRYINGRFRNPEILKDLRSVLNSSENAPLVRFRGRVRYECERIEKILDVDTVQVLEIDGQPWSRRLVEIGSLQHGWHEENPESLPIAFSALDAARALMEFVQTEGRPLPGLFPLDDGGLNVEWASHRRVVSIEIDADGQFFAYMNDQVESEIRELTTRNLEEVKSFILGCCFD